MRGSERGHALRPPTHAGPVPTANRQSWQFFCRGNRRKIGIPEEVIADASELVGKEYINADKYLQDIVRDKRYWENKRQNIHLREKEMEKTIARYETEIAELQRSRKEILRKAKEDAEQLLRESNAR